MLLMPRAVEVVAIFDVDSGLVVDSRSSRSQASSTASGRRMSAARHVRSSHTSIAVLPELLTAVCLLPRRMSSRAADVDPEAAAKCSTVFRW